VATGEVLQLWRHPVKSMRGEALKSTRVDAGGVLGDRAHALVHEHKGAVKPLTARQAPGMLAWSASYPFVPDASLRGDPPPATLISPGGRSYRWGDPRLRRALQEDLGRELDLRREPGGALQDLPRSMLVTTEASRRALEQELGEPVETTRFRSNVHLDLDAAAWEEHGWEGATLAFAGGVELRLLHPCVRCVIPTIDPRTQEKWPVLLRHLAARHDTHFGINAEVLVPGRIQVGERVALGVPEGGRMTAPGAA
jgi:hypothetical protein